MASQLLTFVLLAMALLGARGDSGACDYECNSDGSCKLRMSGNLQGTILIAHLRRQLVNLIVSATKCKLGSNLRHSTKITSYKPGPQRELPRARDPPDSSLQAVRRNVQGGKGIRRRATLVRRAEAAGPG